MKKTIFTLSFIAAAYTLNAQQLYGTTSSGGNNNGGAICKLVTPTNTLTAAFSFDAADGANPQYSKLLQASDGKLYGMTTSGGDPGYGTIFSYDPVTSTYIKLKDFSGPDGANPNGSLVQASDGKLYGMTSAGGNNYYDVIFSYEPATSTYEKLKDFDGTNGGGPLGDLLQASDGKLYGMTSQGGVYNWGVIFSCDPATSTYTKLKDFDDANGGAPYGSLIQASYEKLYGMTSQGGVYNWGVIFSYDPATSAYTKLIDFDGINGDSPYGSFIQASNGKLYGMTSYGGSSNDGVIFSYDLSTSTFTKLKDFNGTNGAHPYGDLVQVSDGNLYGMTGVGGSNGYGVIFSYDPAASTYTKLKDFDGTNGGHPQGNSLTQASDGNLYGMTYDGGSSNYYGVIFSYEPVTSTYTKLRDFGTNNTGNSVRGSLIKDQAKKMYGMTSTGGSYGAGTIFSYDANSSAFTKLKDFDFIGGANPYGSLVQASDGKLFGMIYAGGEHDYGIIFLYDPAASAYTKLIDFDGTNGTYPFGSLVQVSDGKLYGMTYRGGNTDGGVIFSYDPATSTYTKLIDFDGTNGAFPYGSLVQVSNGKLYGMTSNGGSADYGVIFSYDPAASTFTKLIEFDGTNGAFPYGSLVQVSDGKLYGMTRNGGGNGNGVIFSYDAAASIYTKLVDFDIANGAYPWGSLVQASDGKLYGMTGQGGNSDYGVAFSYDPATSIYTKLSDFNGDNGSSPQFTSFIEMPGDVQISILDKSTIESDQNKKFIFIPVTLNESSKKIIRINYTTQNNTAIAGSDYVAQSDTLVFPPGLKKIILPMLIKGDETPEANETFSIILSDPVNATIADSTAIVTISDDDASALNDLKAIIGTMPALSLLPNPAKDKVKVILTGFTGNVLIQLSSLDGRMLQQQNLNAVSSKPAQQQLNISTYTNGIYLVTTIDEKGKRKTEKLVIDR